MREFITKFLLIISIFLYANAGDNKTIVGEVSSVIDINLSKIIKKDNVSVDEANKTAQKEAIVKILSTQTDLNQSKDSQELANIIAQKVVESNETNQNSHDSKRLFDVVEEIKNINNKITLLLVAADKNETGQEIASIERSKDKILSEIPAAITNQTIDKNALLEYLKKKKIKEDIVKRYEKDPTSYRYLDASLDLANMEMGEFFYTPLLKVEQIFIDGGKESKLKEILQKSLVDMQIKDYSKLKTSIDEFSGNSSDLDSLKIKYDDLENSRKSYEEILSYLLKNTNLLAGNVLFTSLNLKDIIDYINDISPFNEEVINLGKIIPIILILVVLFSIRKSLASIIFFIFTFFVKDKESGEAIKSQVVDLIKKPMGVLLVAYGIDICLSIFYYPSPVPLMYATIFDIVYVVLYAWLFVEIINGYGIMLISKFARKSGRKEILNLIVKIAYIIVVIIAILLILSKIGVNVSAIIASLGIGGLAVALATKDIIANFFASIMLLFDNSFSQGDLIVVGDIEGTVVETGLRKTAIRTADNALVFVPNSKIIDNNIKNWSRRKIGRMIEMNVGLSYDATPTQIKECVSEIKQMLMEHNDIAKPKDNALSSSGFMTKYRQSMVSVDDLAGYKNALYVALKEFGDSSINIYVRCYTKTVIYAQYLEVREDVMIKIMEIVDKYGASFAFPSQSVYIEKFPKIEYDNVIKTVQQEDKDE
ncbi:mechanosensitive ion channel family protein [Campylobacter geochelonis]|uniref:mechanosensitive ion channel family protein n=1 Tax=Campylobacter geochelonis TaxID=1780362 RepID=UPI0007709DEE|nr:mechanosensitive ion channel family protein [Campylobacter geochelonis]CZE50748.1 mechanosensitive ion channel family protein [Campylobacter geochelonis]